ncbi:MAG: ABC transporter ATP-binding protein [Lachnospiraceae bacterium]|nr:ABC transporter ATP-binding protein [Lachnospiraceae bacterium]
MSKLLEVENLAAGYGKKKIIRDVSFTLEAGEILAVVGPNGVGKSTLLRTVAGFLPAMEGQIRIAGQAVEQMPQEEHAKVLSVVTTTRPHSDWLMVRDVVAAGRYPYTGSLGILGDEDWNIVDEAMERMEIRELATSYFEELSDGQRQRVLLAKSIAQQPKVLVLDEPTSYLDIRYQLEFVEMALDLAKKQGMGIFLSIHELGIARRLADRVLCLKDGFLDAYGIANDILTDEYIEQLYGIPKGGLYGI